MARNHFNLRLMKVAATHKQRDSIIFQRRLTLLCRPSKQHELVKWRSREKKFDSVLLDARTARTRTQTRTLARVAPRAYVYDKSSEKARLWKPRGM